MKVRRGPVLCDGGDGTHAALTPWSWRGKVLCPNCLLRALSDAIRAGEPIEAERLELEGEAYRRARTPRGRAVVVRLRPEGGGDQLELFGQRRARQAKGDEGDEN